MNDHRNITPILLIDIGKTSCDIVIPVLGKMTLSCDIVENYNDIGKAIMGNSYFLYILDIDIEGNNGPEIAEWLLRSGPATTLILLARDYNSPAVLNVLRMGVYDLIIKPIDQEQLTKSVSKALAFSRLKTSEHAQNKRYREQIARIKEIQSDNLPDFSAINDYEISFSILPAEDMSGDILDSFTDADGRIIVFLCDVNGHGIASAYIGNEMRIMFRGMYKEGMKPSELLYALNSRLIGKRTFYAYMSTAAVCIIDTDNEKIHYSSAGHPPTLHYSSENNVITEIKPEGTLLSAFDSSCYQTVMFDFKKGDYFIIYSDGVVEAKYPYSTKMFGIEKLKEVLLSSINENSRISNIVMDVMSAVYEFTDYGAQEDDISLALIRKK
jgi:serine phosphatase RsbU (regulator of sigma subunit)